MNMKEHILAALKEQFDAWEGLLTGLSEEQLTTPQFDYDWSIKDVIAHLWAWQQISLARLESGVFDRGIEFPAWIEGIEDWENHADQVNAVTFARNHTRSWKEIYQNWREGFLRFLKVGNEISERGLLDEGRYPWLKGYSLAFVLVASYDHHQEHLEKLVDWLKENEG